MSASPSDPRVPLYDALLRGMAQYAQDRLCSEGAHVWSREHRYPLKHDLPPPSVKMDAKPIETRFLTASVRHCQNCGKEERR